MHKDEVDRLMAELESAIVGKRVVQCWLGYGEVAFIGFGDKVIETSPSGLHPTPEFELQTKFADWLVERDGAVVVTSDDEREECVYHLGQLVGLRVVQWLFDRSAGLAIGIENRIVVKVRPLSSADVSNEDSWSVRMKTGDYVVVKCGGTVLVETEHHQ